MTGAIWDKGRDGQGTGYYFRTDHEMLLLGVRPTTPKHFIDRSISSMMRFRLDKRRHSLKPGQVHGLIERAVTGRSSNCSAGRR